ncbi:MoxR-like ATPase [Halopseudomonas xinjiangensis]|uniref:MoxR-like ATPase n=1 Tax=Halopseudomonas xinjiangensis TaxID=487184 RepID=A0A1H1REU2_9GAMM|nr:AAA family ATPase [Halopseudomonas xinjiangensis]SDS34183.1 MoxR-like ATPase [Halopseudomonas xinjiangensis]
MRDALDRAVEAVDQVLFGKRHTVRLAVACLLAKGHLLLEDLPGMGKTTLSQALARVLGLSHQRIQFTSDLLPGDILGTSVFNRDTAQFEFHPGPVFAELILADEINRATPKSQSALLEAMEEGQVTVDGATRALPDPFFVIATQNPVSQSGTYVLPESQLDRFLMRLSLGYPSEVAEKSLLQGDARRVRLDRIEPALTRDQLHALQAMVPDITATDAIIDYILRLVNRTREGQVCAWGLSPRASLGLLAASRAWAMLQHRSYVIPEDVQAVLPAVVSHRLRASEDPAGHGGEGLAQWLLNEVSAV